MPEAAAAATAAAAPAAPAVHPSWMERLFGWDLHLFTLGTTDVALSTLIVALLLIVGLFVIAKKLRSMIVVRMLSHTHLDEGARQTIGMLVQYAVVVIGFLLVMQNIGIDISAFSVVAGALGIGIGFGLQNLFSNFISGLIIMIERPVKVGDRIEISGVEGDVVEIGARTTTLLVAGRARVIMPNQKFVTDPVRNWEIEGNRSSLQVNLNVATGNDPRHVEQVLREVAGAVEGIVDEPPPLVEMTGLDAGGHSMRLLAWTSGDSARRSATLSALHFALHERLTAENIQLV